MINHGCHFTVDPKISQGNTGHYESGKGGRGEGGERQTELERSIE